jgi:hypothetical protein
MSYSGVQRTSSPRRPVAAIALALGVATALTVSAPPVSADFAPATPPDAQQRPGAQIVRTICPNGQTPTPNHSGCWCSALTGPANTWLVAPDPPDLDCRPTERAEGPFCLWSCTRPAPAAHAAQKAAPRRTCHNGAGSPVACFTDDDDVCAKDDYVWPHVRGDNCDSPPDPKDRVYQDARPAAAPAPAVPVPARRPVHASTFVPPAKPGDVWIAINYPRAGTTFSPTSVAVEWNGWQHHEVIVPPAVAGAGFLIRLRHANGVTAPLHVATDGDILAGPTQGPLAQEWIDAGYAVKAW